MREKFIRQGIYALCAVLVSFCVQAKKPIVVIDPGHGGIDPGAIGWNKGVIEKEVALHIAKELKALLDKNPNFKVIMLRSRNDEFIHVTDRAPLARQHNADYLISIHANSVDNTKPDAAKKAEQTRGAYVIVQSEKRENNDIAGWLEAEEKKSASYGKARFKDKKDSYVEATKLDLQYAHAKREAMALAKQVLSQMSKSEIIVRHKEPVPVSASVLRSPDVVSILVEAGFLSNSKDEQLLATPSYRKKVANAIYHGFVNYINKTGVLKQTKAQKGTQNKASENQAQAVNKTSKENKGKGSQSKKVENQTATYHVVAQNETLSRIALKYNTTSEKLISLNHLKTDKIRTGQKLQVK